jgi:hypothetical protein
MIWGILYQMLDDAWFSHFTDFEEWDFLEF